MATDQMPTGRRPAGQGSAGGGERPLIECVPNVSEGRDPAVIGQLVEAVEHAGGRLVDVHSDVDHHRSVFTILGPPEEVEQAVLALAKRAIALIDLNRHRGAHPRVGAIDVIPFVPLRGASMADAVASARRVGLILAAEYDLPVFFYGRAAARRERRELPAIRRGGFEGLADRLRSPGWRPDAGPATPHPTAGAAVIGARAPLVAFNAALESADVEAASEVARRVRESSGGLPTVRAMAVFLASRGLAQVSMNLLDYRRMPPRAAGEGVETEARRVGVAVREYEVVGCAPADLFDGWPERLAPVVGLKPSQLLDPRLFAVPA